ncbi:uroporphyrinogen-III C-methyltransferase [Methanothermus fervidus DSM 2088]|uniref:uroporphyrinogen-III C-methyltransferase n=1 Tax=Methanothermus fervidus (strain ATCC 43054 / DSM 2088 / JCM 10308 / V24 S) TaxID=523846 RepID=E3GX90_METFV|nr:uroporphyrinogen-III C-methyltransferase [Methanothermus fervidus]ADP78085.1 uroporphyrinogen-III C-methyltransferase [Methanothermus fervidus DSM 2088]
MVVYLVGAGPGDPKLITLKALEILKKADVIIYDRLVNKKILNYAKKDAKLIYVGKKSGKHYKTQEEINRILVEEGKKKKVVVRLKGGDPFVFGRGGEEILELKKENIPFKIIPGITSAIGVPTSIGLPLTHRKVSSSFTVVTGHEDPKKDEKHVKWDYKADTLVILMGVGKLKENMKKLMKYRDPKTPVCVIEKGLTPKQRIILGTIDNIYKKDNIKPPAIIIVGEVIKMFEDIILEEWDGDEE